MRRKALSLGLAAVLLLCGGTQKNERTAAALVQAAAASAIQSSTASPESGSITPEQFGARGAMAGQTTSRRWSPRCSVPVPPVCPSS